MAFSWTTSVAGLRFRVGVETVVVGMGSSDFYYFYWLMPFWSVSRWWRNQIDCWRCKSASWWPEVSDAVPVQTGSVASPIDKRVWGRNGCQFLKQDGFFLSTHKTGRQKTARYSPWPWADLFKSCASTRRQPGRFWPMEMTWSSASTSWRVW